MALITPSCWCSAGRGDAAPRGLSNTSGLWSHPVLRAGQDQACEAAGPHPGVGLQVKQLRLEREREKAMREQELEMLQREKEAEHFKTWEEQEDNFHLQQAKLR